MEDVAFRRQHQLTQINKSEGGSFKRLGSALWTGIGSTEHVAYARVSTADQDLSGKKDRLLQHGAVRVFEDVISGETFYWPVLELRVGC